MTGGRIKIGYHTALKLLRDGAHVAVTTRFPRDAARRYSLEADFDSWSDRLTIHQVDFRDVSGVIRFVHDLHQQLPALDILVNNAAQSVKRSAEYYAQLVEGESQLTLPANSQRLLCVHGVPASSKPLMLSVPAGQSDLPPDGGDSHREVIDFREHNSWTYKLEDVQPLEFLEVFLVNSNAPALLTAGLKTLLQRSPFPDRYIINVTGADGLFARTKSVRHPHVNMSKAALNMLTRTSAADYVHDGIYMNSVDAGWITHEGAFSTRARMRDEGFAPPLDEIDGAARIYDPIVQGLAGSLQSGQLFRDYRSANW